MAYISVTEWMFDDSRPRFNLIEKQTATGASQDPAEYKKQEVKRFARHRLFEGGNGYINNSLGDQLAADALAAYTGPNTQVQAGANGERDFICVVDDITTEVAYANYTRQTQVWEQYGPWDDYTFPTT